MAGDDEHDEQVKRRRRAHQRAATTHERAARTEREAAKTSELFDDAQAAEHHREAARLVVLALAAALISLHIASPRTGPCR